MGYRGAVSQVEAAMRHMVTLRYCYLCGWVSWGDSRAEAAW
jgi:hypothetical protein